MNSLLSLPGRSRLRHMPSLLMASAAGLTLLLLIGRTLDPMSVDALVEVAPKQFIAAPGVDHLALELALAELRIGLAPTETGATIERALETTMAAVGAADVGAIPHQVVEFVERSFPDDGARLLALMHCYGSYAAARELTPPALATDAAAALGWLVGLQRQCFGEQWSARIFGQYQQLYSSLGGSAGEAWAPAPQLCAACLDLRDHVIAP